MNYRKTLIRLVTFLGGIYFFLKFVLPEHIGGIPSPDDPTTIIGGFEFGKYDSQLSDGFTLIGAMAFALGLFNLLTVHGSRVAFRRKGWGPSLALLAGLFSMLAVTWFDWMATDRISNEVDKLSSLKSFSERIVADHKAKIVPAGKDGISLTLPIRNQFLRDAVTAELAKISARRSQIANHIHIAAADPHRRVYERSFEDTGVALDEVGKALGKLELANPAPTSFEGNEAVAQTLSTLSVGYRALLATEYSETITKKLYDLLFEGFFIALGAAMFALLGFYICAAAYRAFRIRSVESALMMAAALLVMLGQIPFGQALWSGLGDIRMWLLQVPSAGAARAIEFGSAVAGMVMAFRMWLSIESESFK